jgi:hypothetical protein
MQAKRYFWGITTPFDDNQDKWQRKEAKYKKVGLSNCSKRSSARSAHQRITYKQQKA